jgi:hypothetical protein
VGKGTFNEDENNLDGFGGGQHVVRGMWGANAD